MRRICILALAGGAVFLAAPVSSAFAAGFTLNLSAPSTPVVGQPMILKATGTIPHEYLPYLYWFSLDAIPTSVTSTCPEDHFISKQLALSTGGAILVLSQREVPDAAGNFQIPVGVTPSAPGSLLLCGYTDDGEATTLASTSLVLNIRSAPSRTGIIAADTASAIRSCRALLSPAQSRPCVRRAITRANTRCRRLQPKRSRTACLRAVRRVGSRA